MSIIGEEDVKILELTGDNPWRLNEMEAGMIVRQYGAGTAPIQPKAPVSNNR
jgi:hypothetical protein